MTTQYIAGNFTITLSLPYPYFPSFRSFYAYALRDDRSFIAYLFSCALIMLLMGGTSWHCSPFHSRLVGNSVMSSLFPYHTAIGGIESSQGIPILLLKCT